MSNAEARMRKVVPNVCLGFSVLLLFGSWYSDNALHADLMAGIAVFSILFALKSAAEL
jgi:hypothetical protein